VGLAGALGFAVLAAIGPERWLVRRIIAALLGAVAIAGMFYGRSNVVQVEPRPVMMAERAGQKVFDHGQLDRVLARFVDEHGMVDYQGLKAERQLLDEYVGQLASASPRSAPELFPTDDDRMAYWLNAYNALIMRAVIDHYPIGSVSDIMAAHGVFSRLYFPVGGAKMSLDDIEKGILLEEFDDARVHFALTCASMSCPRIDRHAFTGDGLDARLDQEGRDFLSSRDGVQVDAARGVVRLSKYFDWYGDDFGPDRLAFVGRYLPAEAAAALASITKPRIEYLDYDWRLNDQAATWRAR
jgi:hypothetical protein